MTLAAVFYWLVRDLFGDQPQKIFYLCSLLMGLGAGFFIWKLSGIRSHLESLEMGRTDPSDELSSNEVGSA